MQLDDRQFRDIVAEEGDFDDKQEQLNAALLPLLTEDFLQKLIVAGKVYGWTGDYTEIENFILKLCRHGDFDDEDIPDLSPYNEV